MFIRGILYSHKNNIHKGLITQIFPPYSKRKKVEIQRNRKTLYRI